VLLPATSNASQQPVGLGQYTSIQYYFFFTLHPSRYFNQDEDAGRLMTQTMAALPPSQRAGYNRLQASVRSAYHRSVNARRAAEFRAHLSATQPGASLTPHSRADPRGSAAQKGTLSPSPPTRVSPPLVRALRKARTLYPQLVYNGNARSTTFLYSLQVSITHLHPPLLTCSALVWAVFRLQVVSEKAGGAGNCRIEWEFDDAVLKEAAWVFHYYQ